MIPASADSSHGPSGAGIACPFRRVLVAWDASADAVTALRTAGAIVGDAAGHVVALMILPAQPHVEDERGEAGQAGRGMPRAEEVFERTRASVAATSHARLSLQVAEGRQVARLICDYASDHGFDLLVLGRHGDGGLLNHRLGHVAETAARTSKIPVLLLSAQ